MAHEDSGLEPTNLNKRDKSVECSSGMILPISFIEKNLPMNNKEEFLKDLLKASLALYVVTTSKTPFCDVVKDLFDIEYEAGLLVEKLLNKKISSQSDLHGALAGVFSFIPIKGSHAQRKNQTK